MGSLPAKTMSFFLNLRRIDGAGEPLPKVTVIVKKIEEYFHKGSAKTSFIVVQAICEEGKNLDLIGLRGSITTKEFDANATKV